MYLPHISTSDHGHGRRKSLKQAVQIPESRIAHTTCTLVELAVHRHLPGSCLVRLTHAIRLQSRHMGVWKYESSELSREYHKVAAEAVHLLVGLNRRILRRYLNRACHVS